MHCGSVPNGLTHYRSSLSSIAAEFTGSAPEFAVAQSNLSSRQLTVQSVDWSFGVLDDDQLGLAYNSPNVNAVIQQVVNHPAWSSGNALALIIKGAGMVATPSYETDPMLAPKLYISYTPP